MLTNAAASLNAKYATTNINNISATLNPHKPQPPKKVRLHVSQMLVHEINNINKLQDVLCLRKLVQMF